MDESRDCSRGDKMKTKAVVKRIEIGEHLSIELYPNSITDIIARVSIQTEFYGDNTFLTLAQLEELQLKLAALILEHRRMKDGKMSNL